METLYEMGTVGFVAPMYRAVDAVGLDKQPVQDYNQAWTILFILFVFIGKFFIINLFVGVVVSTFNREQERSGKNYLLTDTQREWMITKLMVLNSKPYRSLSIVTNSRLRGCLQKMVDSVWFDRFVSLCIILNTLVLCLEWTGQSERVNEIQSIFNYIFTAIFTLEAIVKILAYRCAYFGERWNKFDFSIVVGNYIGIIITFSTEAKIGATALVIRSFRILRMMRLIQRSRQLKIIFATLLAAIPQLANVCMLLGLLLYIYSILGVQLFAETRL